MTFDDLVLAYVLIVAFLAGGAVAVVRGVELARHKSITATDGLMGWVLAIIGAFACMLSLVMVAFVRLS